MSQLNEMSQMIEELRNYAGGLNHIADRLFAAYCTAEAPDSPAPPAKPGYTLESVRAILADVSRAGHTAGVRELLQKYGAAKLSEVRPECYEALVADAEDLTNNSPAGSGNEHENNF